ncbi:DUF370 domain-containing protein [Desulfofalx alkaliphila]|uniref:DUF370 domain-containing protein n=1 Tax=Desulfofalx alkaliphila TaxID=105483 RepID=UPI0004E217F9|nr:DUF370 domain-containing protein [Desulfofalx alkaliphila]
MVSNFVNIGHGNVANMDKIIAIAAPKSAPVRRMIHNARDTGLLVDCTNGRLTRSALVTDSGHVILSALHPETLQERMKK